MGARCNEYHLIAGVQVDIYGEAEVIMPKQDSQRWNEKPLVLGDTFMLSYVAVIDQA